MQGSETVFQTLVRKYDDWERKPEGDPPAQVLFRSKQYGYTAVVDRFRKLKYTSVVFPDEGTPQRTALVANLPPSRAYGLFAVTQAISAKILKITGTMPAPYIDGKPPEGRTVPVSHIEGFGVADHPHIVLFPGKRGEGKRLYEADVPQPTPEELDEVWSTLLLTGSDKEALELQLEALHAVAPLLDAPTLSTEKIQNVESFILDGFRASYSMSSDRSFR